MEIQGKITKILDVEKGQKKDGGDWQKINFLVETDEQYNNLYCFEIFGEEKVANFQKYNNVGATVKVSFNVKTNEWQGRYFTSLQAWRVETIAQADPQQPAPVEQPQPPQEHKNDLPF